MTENGQIPKAFLDELTHLINRHSIENVADTPDFLLAGMICRMIEAMGPSIKKTLDWHGCRSVCHPGPRDAVDPPSGPDPAERFIAGLPLTYALMREWAHNLRGKAFLIRAGYAGMAESCEGLARIIDEYVDRCLAEPAEPAVENLVSGLPPARPDMDVIAGIAESMDEGDVAARLNAPVREAQP